MLLFALWSPVCIFVRVCVCVLPLLLLCQVLLDAVEDTADVVVVRAHRGILHLLLSDDKRFNWPKDFLQKAGLHDPVQAFACLMRFLLQVIP